MPLYYYICNFGKKYIYIHEVNYITLFSLLHFPKKMHSVALYTSVAGAYLDLENYTEAWHYADWAYFLAGGKATDELKNLYSKLHRIDPYRVYKKED